MSIIANNGREEKEGEQRSQTLATFDTYNKDDV